MKTIFFGILSSLRSHDIKTDVTTFTLQVGAIALNLLTNLLLARIMLPADYGAFAYASTLIFVLAGLGTLGTQNLLVREAGAASVNNNAALSKSLLSWSFRRSILFSALLLAAFIFISLHFSLFFGNENMRSYISPMLISMGCVLLFPLIYIYQSYLQGIRKIFLALFAEKIVKPALFFIVTTALFFILRKQMLNFSTVAVINLISFLIALLVVSVAVRKSTRHTEAAIPGKDVVAAWKKSSMTFFLFSGVTLMYLRIDMLCLGFFESPEQLGIYNISSRVAETVSFPLHVITFGLAPLISGLFHTNDFMKLQHMVTTAARFIFFLSLIAALLFIFFGTPILSLFGTHFEAGYSSLLILIFGNILNVIAGPAGYILAMTGHERLAFYSMTIACLFNIVMNIILIPLYGISGAAFAVAGSMLLWNILIVFFTITKTGIRPDIFFLLKRNEV